MTVLEEKFYSDLRHCGFERRVKGYDCKCLVIPLPIMDHLLKRLVTSFNSVKVSAPPLTTDAETGRIDP